MDATGNSSLNTHQSSHQPEDIMPQYCGNRLPLKRPTPVVNKLKDSEECRTNECKLNECENDKHELHRLEECPGLRATSEVLHPQQVRMEVDSKFVMPNSSYRTSIYKQLYASQEIGRPQDSTPSSKEVGPRRCKFKYYY